MKAYGFNEYGGPETQDWLELPTPAPLGHELLVEVRVAGVNPVDWKIRAGYMREVIPLDLPTVMGREVSGVVRGVGADVNGFSLGDEVFGAVAPTSGGYAEYAIVPAAGAAKKPANLSFADAAVLPVAATTAYDGIVQLGVTSGQTLIVNGIGGGVGVAAAQIARDLGITVIGVGSERHRELAQSLDAILITYGAGVVERVREVLPDGVDAILDLVGGEPLEAIAPAAKKASSIVSSADPATAEKVGGQYLQHQPPAETLVAVATMVEEGKLDPHITDTFEFEKVAEAIASVESGHTRGKLVVHVSR